MPVKAFWINFLISLLVVFAVSLGIGVILSIFLPFWKATISVFIVLYALLFYITSHRVKMKEIADTRFAEKLIADELRNTVQFVCACNQNTITIPVYANGDESDNRYTCDVCKNDFKIVLNVEPILQTRTVGPNLPQQIFQKLREEEELAVTL